MMRGQPAACALDAPSRCLHCGQPLPAQSGRAGARGEFCCRGCQAVHRLLGAAGLERYYELRRGPGPPVSELDLSRRDRRWLEPLEASLAAGGHLELDVQGIHCAACVWLLEELFRRHPGSLRLIVNPALGSLALDFGPEFALRSFVEEVEALGYLLGPASGEARERASDGLLMRMGICLALAANGMLYAIAIYLGLSEGPLFELLHQLGYAAALLSVLVGGSVFIRSAWRGLRRGLVHLDLPIAIGIVLAFAGSSYAYFAGSAGPLYVDTLTVFIALMLVGRWLQERVLEGHRARLLRDDGIERLWARRVREGKPELVRVAELGAGDELLLGSGDLLAVEAELLDPEGAELSLDWIDGESEPRRFACGAAAPAGAFNAGDRVLRARALAPFAESGLRRLLRTTPAGAADEAMEGPWWQRISKAYVLGVLGAAGVALGGWWSATHDLLRAFEITTAVLVVTCPCAFGIAVPLAYEITLSRLRNGGLFVRRRGFLDRAARIRRVVFDKTGTLTTGRLGLVDASALEGLGAGARVALLNLASRSAHPKSVALLGALEARAWGGFEAALQVEERAGEGLEARIEGVRYRLGSPTFAAKGKVLPSGQTSSSRRMSSCSWRCRPARSCAMTPRRSSSASTRWGTKHGC